MICRVYWINYITLLVRAVLCFVHQLNEIFFTTFLPNFLLQFCFFHSVLDFPATGGIWGWPGLSTLQDPLTLPYTFWLLSDSSVQILLSYAEHVGSRGSEMWEQAFSSVNLSDFYIKLHFTDSIALLFSSSRFCIIFWVFQIHSINLQ